MPVIGKNTAELNFIQNELRDFSFLLQLELKRELKKRNINITGDLINSVQAKLFAAGAGNAGRLQLIFKDYGRFVDMGAGVKTQSIAKNGKLIRSRKRKPNKWYSKTAYGMIYGTFLNQVRENWAKNSTEIIKQALQNG